MLVFWYSKPSLTIFYDMMKKLAYQECAVSLLSNRTLLNWYFTTAQAKSLIAIAIAVLL